jgi:hypothetical protein
LCLKVLSLVNFIVFHGLMISIDINTQRGMLPSVGGNLITGLVDLTCQTVMEVMTGVMEQ